MKIAIGCDHAGYELKLKIISHLKECHVDFEDFGTNTEDSVDYPVYGEKVARAVVSKQCDRGILICGTGVGISLSANKIHGIRAVACTEPYTALLSRQHNDSNILALGSRVIGSGLALMIVDTWLAGVFQGDRHQKRLDMITEIEKKNL
ncbi:MAG: ribose 5-phosphate isomerase B [Treponemataceae bacterium]